MYADAHTSGGFILLSLSKVAGLLVISISLLLKHNRDNVTILNANHPHLPAIQCSAVSTLLQFEPASIALVALCQPLMKKGTVLQLQSQNVADLHDPLVDIFLCCFCSTLMYDVLEHLATDREEQKLTWKRSGHAKVGNTLMCAHYVLGRSHTEAPFTQLLSNTCIVTWGFINLNCHTVAVSPATVASQPVA